MLDNLEVVKKIIENNRLENNFYFSIKTGSDVPFYDKSCIESGDFSWSCPELGHVIFLNPGDLYDSKINSDTILFVDSGEIQK